MDALGDRTRLLEICCAALSALTTGDRERVFTDGNGDTDNLGDPNGLDRVCGDPFCGFGDEFPLLLLLLSAGVAIELFEDDRWSKNGCRSFSLSEDELSPD